MRRSRVCPLRGQICLHLHLGTATLRRFLTLDLGCHLPLNLHRCLPLNISHSTSNLASSFLRVSIAPSSSCHVTSYVDQPSFIYILYVRWLHLYFIPRPPAASTSRPANRAYTYTRRHIAISPCTSSTPSDSRSTPNESDVPSSGGQPNLPGDDGEDEVDPPVVAASGKRGRGGVVSGRGRGAASKPTKCRRY